MKNFIKRLTVCVLAFLFAASPMAFAAAGGGDGGIGGGGGIPTWKLEYTMCWSEYYGMFITYNECDEANGSCNDQVCPC